MRGDPLDRVVGAVTAHHRITVVVMLLLTVGVAAGIPMIDQASQTGGDTEDFEDLPRVRAQEYVGEHYIRPLYSARFNTSEGDGEADQAGPVEAARSRRTVTVYVRDDDGNVLSKRSLLATLRLQRSVLSAAGPASPLSNGSTRSVASLVGRRLAGDPAANLSAQIVAVERAEPAAVRTAVGEVVDRPPARGLLPPGSDPTTTRTDTRVEFVFQGSTGDREVVQRVAHGVTEDRPDFFTVGRTAAREYNRQNFQNTVELLVPLTLCLVLGGLIFAYRDPFDIAVGMLGVVVAVVWMFGLLGWLGVSAGIAAVIGPVLIGGISIDFGFHVFNRYREHRVDGAAVRAAMRRGLRVVAVALALVTVTTGIGFLSNLVNPLAAIRTLGIAITLGVVSALLVFLTLVPAAKVGVDGFLEWAGFERRRAPLGRGAVLEPMLSAPVGLARRAAPVVVALMLVGGALGGAAWVGLDQERFEGRSDEPAEWKQRLPGPVGWDVHPYRANREHVERVYRTRDGDDVTTVNVLIRGDVTDPDTLERLDRATTRLSETGLLVEPEARATDGEPPLRSPLTAMRVAAARNDSFATALQAADTDGDGVPDRDLAALYDRLYRVDRLGAVATVERRDGEYRSLRVEARLAAGRVAAYEAVPRLVEATGPVRDAEALTATLVSGPARSRAIASRLIRGVLETTLLALGAIFLATVVVFRLSYDRGSLGAVVALPIAVVVGLVIGEMYLLGIPLTVLTALLMSIVVGVGVDYAVHLGDRFADEIAAGRDPLSALRASTTGTGGALLGNTVTDAGAFLAFAVHPNPLLATFGTVVLLALLSAFLVTVVALPSLLVLWCRYGPGPSLDAPDVTG